VSWDHLAPAILFLHQLLPGIYPLLFRNCLAATHIKHCYEGTPLVPVWNVDGYNDTLEQSAYVVQELRKFYNFVSAVAFSHDSQLLALASGDKTARLWNPATGEELQKLDADVKVEMISFSTMGPFLETNTGLLKVECYTPPPVSLLQTDPITKLLVKTHWLTRDSENLLWLFPEYRPTCSAFQLSWDRLCNRW
jgi:WD40 repeat protein